MTGAANSTSMHFAQATMQHADINLTMNVYTDPRLLDVRGAMDTLPTLPLDGNRSPMGNAVAATGTDDASPLAPPLAPDWCKRGTPLSITDNMTSNEHV